MTILRYILSICVLFTGACSSPVDIHDTRFMMGTLVEFTIASGQQHLDIDAAINAAANEMQRIEDTFTIYGKQSNMVKTFNASPANTPVTLPAEVSQLLELALGIQQQSHGAFNPALGSLNILWSFSGVNPSYSPPSDKAIEQAQALPHCISHISDDTWMRNDIRCQLDFGAIAKGYAIDQGIKTLKTFGIEHAIINAGGDLRLIGQHGDKAWRIGIRHPRQQGEVIETLELQGDVSIVTSGDYERFYMYQGKRYHHLLDPHTGWPGRKSQSATVIASSATLADAWSTALFIQGKAGIALQTDLQQKALVVDSNGQKHGSLQPSLTNLSNHQD